MTALSSSLHRRHHRVRHGVPPSECPAQRHRHLTEYGLLRKDRHSQLCASRETIMGAGGMTWLLTCHHHKYQQPTQRCEALRKGILRIQIGLPRLNKRKMIILPCDTRTINNVPHVQPCRVSQRNSIVGAQPLSIKRFPRAESPQYTTRIYIDFPLPQPSITLQHVQTIPLTIKTLLYKTFSR